MAERNIVPSLEATATDGTRYSHRDSGWRDSGNSPSGNTKLT